MSANIKSALLVDDAKLMRNLLKGELLSIYGTIRTYEAGTGEEALAIYNDYDCDVVFLDVNMPGIGGIETLNRIREQDPNAIVVMVTSDGSKELVIKAISLGARGYVTKPFSKLSIMRAVENAFKLADQMDNKVVV